MPGSERRRSARHLLGATAEVHVGPLTIEALVHDVSQHGMGLKLPIDVQVAKGDIVWIVARSVAPYAITATVERVGHNGVIGVQFEEILTGETLEVIEALPLIEDP